MAAGEAPPFWWGRPGIESFLLAPASAFWGWVSAWRMNRSPSFRVDVPVLCIGNFIAGGAGKTPTALAFGRAAARRGFRPGFLSRGFGGRIQGVHRVDPARHTAFDVGDEALLLAQASPTVVCGGNRGAGARMLAVDGCDFIVMDDGFQNPSLARDFSLVVVDAKRGIGNGRVMPAGPLRAPLKSQLLLAHAVLVIGNAPGADRLIRAAARSATPVWHAETVPVSPEIWRGKRAIAYAGIADPEKFFDTLASCGANVLAKFPFPDHHPFTDEEATDLLKKALESRAKLVTTSKDLARIAGGGETMRQLAKRSGVLEIALAFEDLRATDLMIDATLANFEERRLRQPGRY